MIIGYRKTNSETNQADEVIYGESADSKEFLNIIMQFVKATNNIVIIDYFIADRNQDGSYTKICTLDKNNMSMVNILQNIQAGA